MVYAFTFWEADINLWSTSNGIVTQDWKYLVKAVLVTSSQLQWRSWWKDEAKTIEQ